MATNWNEILGNTSNLNDVLSILKKVLAGLDAKADFTTVDEALNTINGLDVSVQEKLGELTNELQSFEVEKMEAIQDLLKHGGRAYPTLALANADIANIELDTKVSVLSETEGGDYYKATAGATSLTKSAYDPLVQAKNYTDEEVSSLGISSANNPSISVAIVDDEDNRTWLEADGEGKPTDYSKSLVLEKINPDLQVKVQTEVANAGIEQISTPELAVAIVDSEENRTWLEADNAGKPSQYAKDCITESLRLSGNIVSGPNIVCWGDSMTADVYPSVLKTLLQNSGMFVDVYNMGIGGETSVTICARQGGNPFRVLVDSGVIPSDISAVRVTLLPINGEIVRPLLQGSPTLSGYLGDVHGTLARVLPEDYYTFTRTTAGPEITLNRPTAFYLDVATPRLGDVHVIWIGQNGPTNTRAISDAKAMIQRMQALDKRFLVISKPTSTDADDAAWFSEFGSRFVAARKYLIQYGLQDANITPTAQDLTDISNGVVPTSLRKDSVHWTPTGYSILANVIFKRLKEMGWI